MSRLFKAHSGRRRVEGTVGCARALLITANFGVRKRRRDGKLMTAGIVYSAAGPAAAAAVGWESDVAAQPSDWRREKIPLRLKPQIEKQQSLPDTSKTCINDSAFYSGQSANQSDLIPLWRRHLGPSRNAGAASMLCHAPSAAEKHLLPELLRVLG